jgi:hypothetical protein
MASFNEKVIDNIPAQFFMISSSADNQISNEAYNTSGTSSGCIENNEPWA